MKRGLFFLFSGMILSSSFSIATTLTGVVVDATKSTPIPGASVFVDILIPDSITFSTSSDNSGMYNLPGMPGGNAIYVIRCLVAGFAPLYMRYDALGLGDRQVDLLMYPQATPPGGGGSDSTNVSGIVLYETPGGARNPVAQATVTLTSGGGRVSSQTGGDGRYSMRLRSSSYAITVKATNYETITAGGIAVDSAGLTLNVLLKSTAVSVPPGSDLGPASYALENAYPNPFNPTTVIRYQLPIASDVRLVIFDLLGREVRVLANETKAPGSYEIRFDATGLSSGTYFCRLTAADFVSTRRIVLMR